MAQPQPQPAADPIDLVESAIAGRLALVLAAEIALALRRVVKQPQLLAARKRRQRAREKELR